MTTKNYTRIIYDGMPLTVVSTAAKEHIKESTPFTSYCLTRKDVLGDGAAFKNVCQVIAKNGGAKSVLEMFGGSGWHSAQIQKMLGPDKHMALDLSEDCVESIRLSQPGMLAEQADSYAYQIPGGYDWVHMDFNNFTYRRYLEGKQDAVMLNKAFEQAGRFITITDSAIFGNLRFVKNRQSYSVSIGADPEDWRDYYRAVAERFSAQKGWGVIHVVCWNGMASMMLLKKGAAPKYTFLETKKKLEMSVISTEAR